MIRLVIAADVRQQPVVGEEEKNGGVVMLADREHVEPDFVRALRDPHDRLDPLRLARRVAGDGFRVMSLTEKIPNCIVAPRRQL